MVEIATSSADGLGPAAPVVRPDTAAYPSATTTRFVILLTALFTTGLFLGTWLHNEGPAGDAWQKRVAECTGVVTPTPTAQDVARIREEQRCMAPVARVQVAYSLGGVGVVLAAAVVVVLLIPPVLRRRRPLRAADDRYAGALERSVALAREAQLRASPRLEIGPLRQRDAFSYGIPGDYRVVLPRAVAIRSGDRAIFDPIVRHELVHVRRHDVAVAWVARSLWYVVVPLLAVPLLWSSLTSDVSLLPSYAWRAALLAVTTMLAADALLRSREYDADLRSARTEDERFALRALLVRVATLERKRAQWRSLHPTAHRRVETLDRPARATSVTFVDGLTAAFLAAMAGPLIRAVVSTVPGAPSWTLGGSALAVGPLLGATIGIGLGRDVVVRRVTGGSASVVPVTGGVLLGFAVGQAASLAYTGGTMGGDLPGIAIGALVMAGATVATAGLVNVLGDAAPRFTSRRLAWLVTAVVSGSMFTTAAWVATLLDIAVAAGGWRFTGAVMASVLGGRPLGLLALILATVVAWALWARRAASESPAWAVVGETHPAWPGSGSPAAGGPILVGVVAGTAAAAVIAGYRYAAGAAGSSAAAAQRLDAYVWVFAGAGLSAAVALSLAGLGYATGFVAGPVASLVAALGFVVVNTAVGGAVTTNFLEGVARPGLALGFVVLLVGGLVALVHVDGRSPGHGRPATSRRLVAGILTSALLSGVMSAAALAARNRLPELPFPVAAPSTPADAQQDADEAMLYRASYAPALDQAFLAIERSVVLLDADEPPLDVRAQRVRDECLAPARLLLADARGMRPRSQAVAEAHTMAIGSLTQSVEAFQEFARAYETGDLDAFTRAQETRQSALAAWEAWRRTVEALPSVNSPGQRRP